MDVGYYQAKKDFDSGKWDLSMSNEEILSLLGGNVSEEFLEAYRTGIERVRNLDYYLGIQ